MNAARATGSDRFGNLILVKRSTSHELFGPLGVIIPARPLGPGQRKTMMTPNTITITPQTASIINKSLAVLAIAAFAIAAVTIFPSFGPSTSANAAPIAVKADKQNVATADLVCSEQNWPNYNNSCLRRSESNTTVKQVRLVSTDKL
jgi:hypothetical protein